MTTTAMFFKLNKPTIPSKINFSLVCASLPKIIRRLRYILPILLTLLVTPLLANNQPKLAEPVTLAPPKAVHLTQFGDINIGQVNHIFEDSHNIIWIASSNGLIKHNGSTSKLYSHDANNPNSIATNWIMDIIEDRNGNLWLTSLDAKLIKFNPLTEQFTTVDVATMPSKFNKNLLFYNQVIDQNNYLWIATSAGPKRVNLTTEQAEPLPPSMSDISNLINQRIAILNDGSMIFCYFVNGFYWYKDGQLKHFSAAPEQSGADSPRPFPTNKVRTVFQDQDNNIYLGTNLGMVHFNPQNETFKVIEISPTQSANKRTLKAVTEESANDIMNMNQDINGTIWAGLNDALAYYKPKLKRFFQATNVTGQLSQYPNVRYQVIVTDSIGNLWLGTTDGIVFISASALSFDYYTNENKTLLIQDIESSKSDRLEFIANYQHRIYHLDKHKIDKRLPPIGNVYQINKQDNGQVWFGTIGDGIFRRNNPYSDIAEQLIPDSLKKWGIYDFVFDNQNRVWAITISSKDDLDAGLFVYDINRKTLEAITPGEPMVDLVKLDERYLLTGAIGAGLVLVDTHTNRITRYKGSINNSPNHIFDIYQAKDGRIWIATGDKGLVEYHRENPKFNYIDTNSGFSNNTIYSITEDLQSNLWLGTQAGLIRFNPNTKAVKNITDKDGLLFTSFRRRAANINQAGQLLFGSNEGIVKFDPAKFNQVAPTPNLQFDQFKLFNRTVNAGDSNNILKQPINVTQTITLDHQDYLFSIHFSANEYTRPDNIQFAYRLKELSEQWIYTDAQNRQASFTTLAPGRYTFELKSTNRDGQWSDNPRQLSITITPPFYRTWTAYIIYFFAFVFSLVGFIKYRTNKLTKAAKLLEAQVQQRTEQLQQNRDELAEKSRVVSDLLAQKQKLFSSISHEFRTPLTLILSPIEQLLNDTQYRSIKAELKLMQSSGNRLLRMVNQLLEFAKLEQQQQQQFETLVPRNAVTLICASFEPVFASKKLKFTSELTSDAKCTVIVDSLNKIVINLLSNAVKYTPENGIIEVSVTADEQQLFLTVKDNGIGISQTDQQHIFERFNRANNHDSESIPGAGIGLALVKELVEANQGAIKLQSQLQQGSTFTVTLPIYMDEQPPLKTNNSNKVSNNTDSQIDLELSNLNHLAPIEPKPNKPIAEHTNDNQIKPSILIVEDNNDLQNLLSNQLSDLYQCLIAANGQIGLDIATNQLPDLIISDVMMPVLDGYQLSQRLKSEPLTCHIPIILLSAKGSVESRIKGLENLVDDYLAKPYNIQELRLRISNILNIRKIVKKQSAKLLEQQGLKGCDITVKAPITEEKSKATKKHNLSTQQDDDQYNQLNPHDRAFCQQVYRHIEKCYQDGTITQKHLAKDIGISERQLQRKMKAVFDFGLPELLSSYRLNKASELLKEGYRVSTVFYEVGFSSHSYFSLCFKAKFGVTPKQYQKANS